MNVNDTNEQFDYQFPHQNEGRKCHGDRRDQRFRKKCRTQGMKSATITKLLKKRNQAKTNHNNNNNHHQTHNNLAITISNKVLTQISGQLNEMTPNLNKRKRNVSLQELKTNQIMTKSASLISISQPSSKKAKEKKKIMATSLIKENSNSINKNYRFVSIFTYNYCP